MPSAESIFGKLLRLFAVLIMVFPLVFLLIGVGLGFFMGPVSIIAAFIGFIIFLFLCSILGAKLYSFGLEIELKANGMRGSAELRKELEPLLGDRPESLKGVEVPESLARVDIPISAPKKKKEVES
jgi:hypothetical protein